MSVAAAPPAFIAIADASPALRERLITLNNADAERLSHLTPQEFDNLVADAYAAWMELLGDALLIAMAAGAAYQGVHYRWFAARLQRFVYVDRIVVGEAARGRGLARGLYAALCEQAEHDGYPLIVCEVNVTPPNPTSHAFHTALGFEPIADASYGAKTVRYYQKRLSGAKVAPAGPLAQPDRAADF